MIYEANIDVKNKLFPIFEDMEDTMILSCLQGHMGKAYVDNIKNPTAAEIIVGELVFFAGDPNAEAAAELLNNLPANCFVVVSTDGWKDCIEKIHEGYANKFQRYAFKKDKKYLNYNHIKSLISMLPEGYELKKVDKDIAYDKSFHELSEDFTAQFDSIEDYLNRGVGFCILHEGKVVCGASSYSVYDSGIEIQIDTDPKYRRKGLATVAAAALILHCLDRGIYPSWDAANLTSVHLAEKLGYVMDGPYDTYHIKDKK
ncbi:GNAT family N-acetyltransferase [Clostridium hydrogenum]|uniref:GNAT family N-acetyltransferase n=1 Tax=Clostridium hydrogenum TaxID=2855764 RepID=UPI002E34ADF7|nr:GNAT family N-acetyltransferase [Clostridium hydrogenum]